MRILTNTLALSPGTGVDLTVLTITRELTRRGHQVDLFAQAGGSLEDEFRSWCDSVAIPGAFLHGPVSPSQLRHPTDLARWAATAGRAAVAGGRLAPDVVWANDAFSLPWAVGAARWAGAPIVCSFRNLIFGPMGLQRKFYARFVEAFTVSSSFVRNLYASKGVPAQRIRVVPPGVDPSDYPQADESRRADARRRLHLPAQGFVALYFGRLVADKGIEVLFDAWRRLPSDHAGRQLLVVGDGYPPDYVRHLAGLAPPDCRLLPGRRDVVTPLHAADVVVVPSVWDEPFGRVVIEAMATGCPVVASAVGGIPEILTGRFSSMLFPRGDARNLADRIETLAGWRTLDPSLAAACVRHVAERFSLRRSVDLIEETLADVVDLRGGRFGRGGVWRRPAR
jgi:glycosyltransferase involved in cell wall biosynthesis